MLAVRVSSIHVAAGCSLERHCRLTNMNIECQVACHADFSNDAQTRARLVGHVSVHFVCMPSAKSGYISAAMA